MRRIIPLILSLAPAVGLSCPSDIVCLAWQASSTYNDGAPLSSPVYTIYRIAGDNHIPVGSTSGLELVLTGQPRGQQCFIVTAKDAQERESLPSAPACKTVRAPAPTDGSIEAPTDGSIEFPK